MNVISSRSQNSFEWQLYKNKLVLITWVKFDLIKSIGNVSDITLYFMPKLANKHFLTQSESACCHPTHLLYFIYSTNAFWGTISQVCDGHWKNSGEQNMSHLNGLSDSLHSHLKPKLVLLSIPKFCQAGIFFITLSSLNSFCLPRQNH